MLTPFTHTFGGIKKATSLPVAVGFGVKSPPQAKALRRGRRRRRRRLGPGRRHRRSLGADGSSTSKTVPAVLDLVQSLAGALRAA